MNEKNSSRETTLDMELVLRGAGERFRSATAQRPLPALNFALLESAPAERSPAASSLLSKAAICAGVVCAAIGVLAFASLALRPNQIGNAVFTEKDGGARMDEIILFENMDIKTDANTVAVLEFDKTRVHVRHQSEVSIEGSDIVLKKGEIWIDSTKNNNSFFIKTNNEEEVFVERAIMGVKLSEKAMSVNMIAGEAALFSSRINRKINSGELITHEMESNEISFDLGGIHVPSWVGQQAS